MRYPMPLIELVFHGLDAEADIVTDDGLDARNTPAGIVGIEVATTGSLESEISFGPVRRLIVRPSRFQPGRVADDDRPGNPRERKHVVVTLPPHATFTVTRGASVQYVSFAA